MALRRAGSFTQEQIKNLTHRSPSRHGLAACSTRAEVVWGSVRPSHPAPSSGSANAFFGSLTEPGSAEDVSVVFPSRSRSSTHFLASFIICFSALFFVLRLIMGLGSQIDRT